MKIQYILFGMFILFLSLYSQAQKLEESEKEILQTIVELGTKEQKTPMEIIEFLDPIIIQSKLLGWQNVYLEAITKKTEKLVDLEQISAAKILLDEILPLAKKLDNQIILIRLAICDLNVLERKGYSQELDSKYRSLLVKAKTINDDKTLGNIYLAAGRVKSRLAEYSEALNSLHKAYNIAEKLNDISFLDQVSGEIGTANIRMENFDEGIAYYLKSLEISQEKNAKYDQSVILYNLGKAYLLNDNFPKSQEMFEKSILLNLDLKDDIGLMWSKRGLADLALKQQEWNKAIKLYHEAVVFFSKVDDKMSEFNSLNGQAEAYIALGDADSAEISLISSYRLLSAFPTSENTLRYQQLLSDLESLNGNYKAALDITKDNIKIIKKANLVKKNNYVEKQRIHLDSELKETENRLLTEKNGLQELKIIHQQKQQYLWYLIIGLSVMSLIVVTYMLYKQIQLRNRFEIMALKDYLTRSPNRRAILEYANSCFNKAVMERGTLTIGLVDLDNFKQFNDTYGHDIGDNVLIAFSKACKNSMRDDYKYGKYGRYGGEEWLIVLPQSSKEIAENIFSRIKENFSNLNIKGLPQEHKVTFSIGVQIFDKNTDKSVANIISKADKKLYLAKQQGKNKVVF
jgi:diguanylate cyclase (GGDEF)-like protein